MASHLTRQQMYTLVWTSPLSEVASQLGLSEWALKELCDRHRVPIPKPSFWRDKADGKRPKQAIFTTTDDARLELIPLDPTIPIEANVRIPPPRIPEVPTRESILRMKANAEPGDWTPVERPHPLLAPTARALRNAKPDRDDTVSVGGENIPWMSLGQASVERAIFILDSLLRSLIAQGITCTLSRKEFTAARDQDAVSFKLSEKIAKVQHEPTLSELQAEARRLRNGGSNYDWYWNKAYPEFDFVPTGTLRVSVTSWGGMGLRRNWQDGKRASLDSQITAIATALDDWIAGERQHRLKRERQSRLWRRADENRALAEARKKREGAREALVTEIIDLGTKASHLRTWIEWAALIADPDTKRMLAWARQRLASIERALAPESFGDWLRERNLFPEKDPYAPLPEDPDLEIAEPDS
jgi:hypothetical protein